MKQHWPKIILGARGQVGKALARTLTARGEKAWISSRTPADGEFLVDFEQPETITAFFAAFVKAHPGERACVFLTGAFTHVDGCEQNPEKCMRINRDGPILVAKECAAAGHHLVFFSSEYVFGNAEYEGGAIGPFRETDSPAPTSIYGQAKADAEAAILAMTPTLSATIIRTTVVFSWNTRDMNFAMQLRRFLQQKIQEAKSGAAGDGQKFRIPTDQISTPTYAPALVAAALQLGESCTPGIYHIVGSDLLSRADFTEKLIDLFGFSRADCAPFIEYLPTRELKQPARRPLSAGLCTEKAKAAGVPIWSLEQAFSEFHP